MNAKIQEQETEKQLLETFKAFDKNGDGFISAEELKEGMQNLG